MKHPCILLLLFTSSQVLDTGSDPSMASLKSHLVQNITKKHKVPSPPLPPLAPLPLPLLCPWQTFPTSLILASWNKLFIWQYLHKCSKHWNSADSILSSSCICLHILSPTSKDMVCKDFASPGPYPTYVLQNISQFAVTSTNPFPAIAPNDFTSPIP